MEGRRIRAWMKEVPVSIGQPQTDNSRATNTRPLSRVLEDALPGTVPAGVDSNTETVLAAFGVSEVRLAILRILRGMPDARISVIARTVGCTRNGLKQHLQLLEAAGLVQSHLRRVTGSFRPARCYMIDEAHVEDAAWTLFEALTSHTEQEY